MKPSIDIEKLLFESKLPDQKLSNAQHQIWQQILDERKKRHQLSIIFRIKPWMWALASVLLMLLCIALMIALYRS